MLVELLYSGGAPGRLARLRLLRRFRALREELALAQVPDFDASALRAAGPGNRSARRPSCASSCALDGGATPAPSGPGPRGGRRGAVRPAARKGVVLAVWSDYPVAEKLAALGLEADHLLAATRRSVLSSPIRKACTRSWHAPEHRRRHVHGGGPDDS